jgi:surfactin synthase thioesterase subunit
VYALGQAGGGATTFAGLAERLAPHTCVWALNLPGRQARFHEPSRTDLEPLLDELAADLAGRDGPVLLGYCSGALIAFLVARRMRRLGLPPPAGMLIVSYPSPDRARPPRGLHELDSDRFWREILSYGGVPDKVAEQSDFREIFEPALRADYALLAGYEYAPEPALATPITVVHGRADPVLHADDVDAWRAHTTGDFRVIAVPGDHWLLDGDPAGLADAVRGSGLPRVAAVGDGVGG